ncbi:MAG: hypothetical protein R3E58_15070 [Phycisphaerae bacterium]
MRWFVSGAVLAAMAISGGTLYLQVKQQRAIELELENKRLVHEQEELARKNRALALQAERLKREKAQLDEVIERLDVEERVAEIEVLQQHRNAQGDLQTVIRFTEFGRGGKRLEPLVFGVPSNTPHFDALVIKFERDYVKRGDALRGHNLALFRRVYGDTQSPNSGYWIGERSGVPDLYRIADEPTEFELNLWNEFWEYAANPDKAADAGVRVAQGESVYAPMKPGELWRLSLDAGGGLNLKKQSPETDGAAIISADAAQLSAPSPLGDLSRVE